MPVRKTDAPHSAGDDHDIAADLLAEILLKDTAVIDFNAFDQLIPPTVRVSFSWKPGTGLKRPTPCSPKSFGSIERICSSMAWRASTGLPPRIASRMRRCEPSERRARSCVCRSSLRLGEMTFIK